MGCITGQPSIPLTSPLVAAPGLTCGVVQAENAAEGPLQLEAHHREQIGIGGAEAVEQDDGVGDGGVGVDVVEPYKNAIVLATVLLDWRRSRRGR